MSFTDAFDFTSINYAEQIVGIVIAVLQAIVIAVLTKFLLDQAFKDQRLIGKNLQKYGIHKVHAHKGGTLSKAGKDVCFGLNGKLMPSHLDLCFISGWGFFRDYEMKAGYLRRLVANGCQIRVLLANPDRGRFKDWKVEDYENPSKQETLLRYYTDLFEGREEAESFLERSYAMLLSKKVQREPFAPVDSEVLKRHLRVEEDKTVISDSHGDHSFQVKYIQKLCHELARFADNGGKIELRFYEDEYQMPIIMATSYTDAKSKKEYEETVYLWTNMNAPIKETSESINISCYSPVDEIEDKAFVNDVQKTFEYLWNRYRKSNPMTETID